MSSMQEEDPPEGAWTRREVVGVSSLSLFELIQPRANTVFNSQQINQAQKDDGYDWTMYRGSPTLTGSRSRPGIESFTRTAFSIGGGEQTTIPAIKDDVVYAARDGDLLATDLHTGTGVWIYRGEKPFVGCPAITAQRVVGVTTDGQIIAVDRESGDEQWSVGINGKPGYPTISNGSLYVADHYGTVYAFNSTDGELLWSTAFEGEAPSNSTNHDIVDRPTVSVGADTLYVNIPLNSGPPSRIVALSTTGETRWEYALDIDHLSPPVITDHGIVVSTRTELRMITKTGGVEQWTRELRADSFYPPAAGPNYIAAVDNSAFGNPRCNVYDIQTGEEHWTYAIEDGTTPGGATITDNMVYFTVAKGARDAQVTAVGLNDGLERFSIQVNNAAIKYGPIPLPNGIFVPDGTDARLLTKDTATTATPTDQPTPGDTPVPSTTAPTTQNNGQSIETTVPTQSDDSPGTTVQQDGTNSVPPLSLTTVESIVVIITSLCGGIYTLYKIIGNKK